MPGHFLNLNLVNPVNFFVRHLGPGFLEKICENALRIELERAGFKAKQQEPINVDC